MQFIKKYLPVLLILMAGIYSTYTFTKNSYIQKGQYQGEINTKYEIYEKLKIYAKKCNNTNTEGAKEILYVKSSRILILQGGDLCYRD